MKKLLALILVILSEQLHAQVRDTVNFQFMDGNKPLIGTTIYIQKSEPPTGTVTNVDGHATLKIPNDLRTVELSFLGPYIAFELPPETDSVYLNLKNRKLLYFSKNKRTKKQKLKIEGY